MLIRHVENHPKRTQGPNKKGEKDGRKHLSPQSRFHLLYQPEPIHTGRHYKYPHIRRPDICQGKIPNAGLSHKISPQTHDDEVGCYHRRTNSRKPRFGDDTRYS